MQMGYRHLDVRERETISQMRFAGATLAAIAQNIGRCAGTISRELNRNKSPSREVKYSAHQAQRLARERRKAAKIKVPKKISSRRLLRYVKARLQREWSPEQIAGRLKLDLAKHKMGTISHVSIYAWIRANKLAGGVFHRHLRQAHRKRRSRYGSQLKRFHVAGKVSIDDRPKVVETRSRIGDWEGDLMEGKDRRSYLLTIVDRRSGYLLVSKVGNKTSGVVRDASVRLLQKMKTSNRKTLTFDNGTEFSCFHQIASRAQVKVYFAHPYSSWERGTNENTNGLLRQYVPKGSDIRVLPHSRLAAAAVKLNNRPRKRLGYQTPAEVLKNNN